MQLLVFLLATINEFGLTFGQILSLIAMCGGIVTVYVTLQVRIAKLEVSVKELQIGRQTNANNIEVIRKENREDHKDIMGKLDTLIEKVNDYRNEE